MKGTDLKYNNLYYNSVRINVHVGTLLKRSKIYSFDRFSDKQLW